jgi:lysophospholipase L1-like esterase
VYGPILARIKYMRFFKKVSIHVFAVLLLLPLSTASSFAARTQAPGVTTNAATSVTATGATLNGNVNPNGLATTAWFEWGTDPTLATFGATPNQSTVSRNGNKAISATLSGLTSGTTYYFRVAASNSAGTLKGSIASFSTVLGDTGGAVIPQTNWRLWYVDSEETVGENGVAENAFDDSAGTFWHTQWYGSSPPPPHEIQIDLAGNYSINGFRYLPRQDGFANGTIKNYEFYVSVDGINWGSPVASGTFANTTAVKEVLFNAKSGRYVRLRALSEVNGNPWTSAAELNVLGNGTAFKGYYVAVGDSITWGSHDDIPIDDTSLDLRNTGGGFEPILNNLLTAAKGFPHNVVNAGVSGDASADGAAKISTTLSNHPSADYFLIMYGTNDAWYPPIPSGKGLNPGSPGYSGSYKDHMQQIISAVLGAGKTPYLAKVPYSSQPLLSDASIREYNTVINELVVANGITVTPPDFYTWFQSNPGQLADTVHPNGTGYQSMAGSIPNPYSWFTALTQ